MTLTGSDEAAQADVFLLALGETASLTLSQLILGLRLITALMFVSSIMHTIIMGGRGGFNTVLLKSVAAPKTHTHTHTLETPISRSLSHSGSDGTQKTHVNLQNCTYYFRKLQLRGYARVAPCLPQHNINTHHPVRLNGVDITFLAGLQSTPVAIFFSPSLAAAPSTHFAAGPRALVLCSCASLKAVPHVWPSLPTAFYCGYIRIYCEFTASVLENEHTD